MTPAVSAAYSTVLLIFLTGLAIGTAEFLCTARAFASSGIFSWRIVKLSYNSSTLGRLAAPFLRRITDPGGIRALLLLRLLLILSLFLAPQGSPVFSVLMAFLVASTLLFTLRRTIGDDGSDQLNSIIMLSLFLCVGPHSDSFILNYGLWFLAAQACLAYTTAGVAKLTSPVWRSGDAIYKVFNTFTYGNERVADILARRRWLRLVLCWQVILVESLFPLCLVLPQPCVWVFLGLGILFHIGCAVIMGLNCFLFAFVATYPAVYYVSCQVSAALWD